MTVLTDYTGLVFHQARVSDLGGRPVISYPRDTRYAIDRALKRALDVVAGVLFLVVSLPFYVVYSLYALSRGRKPFTYDDRVGSEGEHFTIPVVGGGRAAGPSDFVNLPLFWLVVVGRLSIIGPYPMRPEDAEHLRPAERFRFDVRPGITGYWRTGQRQSMALNDLLAQDANYLRNWSLTQDAKLLLTTLPQILTGRSRNLTIVRARERIENAE